MPKAKTDDERDDLDNDDGADDDGGGDIGGGETVLDRFERLVGELGDKIKGGDGGDDGKADDGGGASGDDAEVTSAANKTRQTVEHDAEDATRRALNKIRREERIDSELAELKEGLTKKADEQPPAKSNWWQRFTWGAK